MATRSNSNPTSTPPTGLTGSGCLIRMLWFLVAHAVLLLSAAIIVAQHSKFFSPVDAVFCGAVIFAVVIRYLDIRFFCGATGTGNPATMRHWRRYAILLILVSLIVWAAAHAVGHYTA